MKLSKLVAVLIGFVITLQIKAESSIQNNKSEILEEPNIEEFQKNWANTDPNKVVNLSRSGKTKDGSFILQVHDSIADNLSDIEKECSKKIIYAQWFQDIFHQVHSYAHFDNCAFEDGLTYVNELINDIDSSIQGKSVIPITFRLGQALHAIQDFYAHSDFVEKMKDRHESFNDVDIVRIWTPEGAAKVRELVQQGLHSGTWSIGSPQRCGVNAESHDALNKDDDLKSEAGKKIITKWNSINQHQAALQLATQASHEFIMYAYKKWPLLQKECGKNIEYSVLTEKRI